MEHDTSLVSFNSREEDGGVYDIGSPFLHANSMMEQNHNV